MKRQSHNIWFLFTIVCGVAYPFLVYFYFDVLPLWAFVLGGLCLIGIRLSQVKEKPRRSVCWAGFLGLVLFCAFLYYQNAPLAAKAYPVLVSLSVAALFGFSLWHPPTIVERMARLTEPELPPRGVAYARRVTWVWFIFLLLNASVSIGTALWGTLDLWTLWNGLLSYLCMGALFAGEYIVRKFVRL